MGDSRDGRSWGNNLKSHNSHSTPPSCVARLKAHLEVIMLFFPFSESYTNTPTAHAASVSTFILLLPVQRAPAR